MSIVILSIVVLWTAPFVHHWLGRRLAAHRLLERIVLSALGVLVVVEILPASFAVAGWLTPALAAAGLALPSLVEHTWHRAAHRAHWVPLVIAASGLALHACLDGAALVDPFETERRGMLLPLAILMHRFFEGIFIWWALRPRFGWEIAAAVLGLSSSFTLAGYLAGQYYIPKAHSDLALALFQAVVAGSLLHLAVDRHAPESHAGHEGAR